MIYVVFRTTMQPYISRVAVDEYQAAMGCIDNQAR